MLRRIGSHRSRAPSSPPSTQIVAAAIGLLLTAPLMLVIAALIKLTSRGPALYTQTGVGMDRRRRTLQPAFSRRRVDAGGRPFTIYKFRTMRVSSGDAEVWAQPDDPRVTLLGRVLRKSRLDELPQLFNVLRGDMNIVGPRPEQPNLFKDLHRHTKIGRPPGSLLLAATEFLFSRQTHERVFVPIVRDLHDEYSDDLAAGRRARARWVVVRGWWGFGAALLQQSFFLALKAVFKWIGVPLR